jgi:hypothetical protein
MCRIFSCRAALEVCDFLLVKIKSSIYKTIPPKIIAWFLDILTEIALFIGNLAKFLVN